METIIRTCGGAAGAKARFHIPFEHGAWWAFGSTLAGGLTLALFKGADTWACAGAALALASGFLAQDWGQALVAAVLRRPSQAASSWRAWPGWSLAVSALCGLALQLFRTSPARHTAWLTLWSVLALAAGLGLACRVLQKGRGRGLLALTALLLAAPALPLGVLAFGFKLRVLELAFWPLLYFPAATLSAQSYIRGHPEKARWAGPTLAGLLGCVAFGLGAWTAGPPLCVNAFRLDRRIRARWRRQPAGRPQAAAIRSFGREQAAWGLTLTVLWVLAFRSL